MKKDKWIVIDLAPYWDDIKRLADERHEQKVRYKSTRQYNPHTHFVGLLGETVFAIASNLETDTELKIKGDDGKDFVHEILGRVDIKTSTYYNDPILKEFTNRQIHSDAEVLVALDMQNKKGAVVGYATKQEVLNANTQNFGYGDMYAIEWGDLTPMPKSSPYANIII